MEYTISIAWVRDVPAEEMDGITEAAIHKDIVARAVTTAEFMRAKYPDEKFKCILADAIISTPEIELAPKR